MGKFYIDMEKIDKLAKQTESHRMIYNTPAKCDNCGASAIVGNFITKKDFAALGDWPPFKIECPWCGSKKVFIGDVKSIFKEVL